MKTSFSKALSPGILIVLLSTGFISAADWPQWRGLNRDGISRETGLLNTWPVAGPAVLWRTSLGNGFSGLSVSQGRIFTMGSVGTNEFALCFDSSTGKELWRSKTDLTFKSGHGDGPRSTPTVDGNWIFVLGAQGKLLALSAKDGKKIWSHDLRSEFGTEIPGWGTSTSPLVEGDLLLVDIGGKTGHSIGAFNKKSGALAWKTHTDKQSHSSPIAIQANGKRQILFLLQNSLVSVSPTGILNWQYPFPNSGNIATPVFIPPDKVYISASYDMGAAVLKLIADKDKLSFQELWKSKIAQNHFNTSVFHNAHLYGFDNSVLQCIEANTGKEKWKKSGFGKGSLILAEGNLIVLGERGQLALIEATPTAYKEKSRVQAIEGKTWTVPSLANGKLYLRNETEMICMNLKAQ